MQKRSAARNTILISWHKVHVFAVQPVERRKYFANAGVTWRVWELLYELCKPTLLIESYFTGKVLKGGRVTTLPLCIIETKCRSPHLCFSFDMRSLVHQEDLCWFGCNCYGTGRG